jgi:hypothetical protein
MRRRAFTASALAALAAPAAAQGASRHLSRDASIL